MAVTEKQIQELTDIVVRETKPLKVYLFGSHASGEVNINSDIDVLVVLKEDLTKEERRNTIARLSLRTALDGLLFAKDFKVYSVKEFELYRNDRSSFLNGILSRSKHLYAG